MTKKLILTIVCLLAVIAAVYFYLGQNNNSTGTNTTQQNNTVENTDNNNQASFNFSNPKKSAHYETNTPAHGSILAAPPVNIVIDFNFDLAPPSSISITKDGKEYGVGTLTIDNNKLAMRRNFDQQAPDGLYKVSYNACWPDRSCHDGYFEFAIDRSLASSYQDLSNIPQVEIKLSEIMFKPQNIKIKAGTKVTWINDESVEHYINSDSHPAHTYYSAQNSKALKKGENFSLMFDKPGIYPYHCSAHADVMTGNIIVI